MKKWLIVVIALAFACSAANAQTETLFNNARVKGGFAGPIFQWGLSNDLGTYTGGGAGIVVGNMFFGGYGLGNIDFKDFIETGDVQSIKLAHGGFWIGGNVPTRKLVHLYSSAKIGWGALEINVNDPNLDYYDLDKVFVLNPEVGIELNVTRWFRVGGTVGYQYVNGVNANQIFTDKDFRGYTAGLTLRFGWFGGDRKWENN
jgi:hypothetical protein